MRRVPGWVWTVGAVVAMTTPKTAHAAGVWVTLAAGLSGAAPTSEADLWFDSPHAPPYVAVTSVPGTLEAGTTGGTVSFGGLGTPLLLNLADGSAYLAGGAGSVPEGGKNRGPKGGNAGSPAGATPLVNATVPDTAALLGLKLADPDSSGSRDLTATVTDAGGNVIGTGTVSVPDGGYYVIGLGPDAGTTPPPVIDPPPTPTPDPTPTPTPEPPVVDPVPESPGPVATPEPSSLVLAAVGGIAATTLRRYRTRKA
ncbi:hypothetical protein [Urbifossiella limnaea]|uniref:PEP-CTERM sorting domain-containing protein n=1 Tax=Urbifossiella limnaea TaxID=2528023 RepID=A0A517XRG2_9BACT|nr:hypothetical protein [Urbifossiella limnaea]QDU20101.1 hypothetical protein ETAA1_20440 [Urbifossiella limnaea]